MSDVGRPERRAQERVATLSQTPRHSDSLGKWPDLVFHVAHGSDLR